MGLLPLPVRRFWCRWWRICFLWMSTGCGWGFICEWRVFGCIVLADRFLTVLDTSWVCSSGLLYREISRSGMDGGASFGSQQP